MHTRSLPAHSAISLTTRSLIPRLRIVSIIPGMENLAPDRTDTRSGVLPPPPKLRPVLSSSLPMAPAISSQIPSGPLPLSMNTRHASVVMVNPGEPAGRGWSSRPNRRPSRPAGLSGPLTPRRSRTHNALRSPALDGGTVLAVLRRHSFAPRKESPCSCFRTGWQDWLRT